MESDVSVMQEHQQVEPGSQHSDVAPGFEQQLSYKGYSSVVTQLFRTLVASRLAARRVRTTLLSVEGVLRAYVLDIRPISSVNSILETLGSKTMGGGGEASKLSSVTLLNCIREI